jgi:hypothetical protein
MAATGVDFGILLLHGLLQRVHIVPQLLDLAMQITQIVGLRPAGLNEIETARQIDGLVLDRLQTLFLRAQRTLAIDRLAIVAGASGEGERREQRR